MVAVCIVDCRRLVSDLDEAKDEWRVFPLRGVLKMSLMREGQSDHREIIIGVQQEKDGGMAEYEPYIYPMNVSSYVHAYVLECMDWSDATPCKDPEEHSIGDCLMNSGGGLDYYCQVGGFHVFEIDIDPSSPTFGKIV